MAEVAASTCLTLKEIENELSEVTGADWYPLGVQLGLRPPTLREILNTYPLDSEWCRREMLDLWLRSTPEASWKSLAQAVQALGRYTSLALKLRRKVPPAPKAPSVPTIVSVEATSSTSISVQWKASKKDGGSPITGYVVEYCPTSNPSFEAQMVASDVFSTTLDGLTSSTEYDVRVRGENAVGCSVPSAIKRTKTDEEMEEVESVRALKEDKISFARDSEEDESSSVGTKTDDEVEERVDTAGDLQEDESSSAGDSDESSSGGGSDEEETDLRVQQEKKLLKTLRKCITRSDVDSFHRHLNELERVVQNNNRIKELLNESGLLCLAAFIGSNPAMEKLIRKGVDINTMSTVPEHPVYPSWKMPPLHWAADGGHVNTVKFLVEKGANLHSKDDGWNTPLQCAADRGHTDTVQCLIDSGAGINITNCYGRTPLHWAAGRGHVGAVEYLIQAGAELNIKDIFGRTPLHLAAGEGTAHILIEKGADINVKDSDGMSPLHWAADRGHVDIVKCLTKKGANLHSKDEYGRSPLHKAAEGGHANTVELLLQPLANINIKDIDGWTPLHLAAFNGHVETARLLVGKGTDINVKDNDGRTPLDLAAAEENEEVLAYLKRAADPNMRESESNGRVQEQRQSPQEIDNSPSEEPPPTAEKEEAEKSDHEDIDSHLVRLLEKYQHEPKIKHKSLKCLFTGPPRVGKTTLKKRLLKTIKNLITSGVASPSGGLEKPISVIIGETRECVTVVMESDLDWQPQHDLLDEAQIVLEFIDKSHHQSLPTSCPTTVLPKPMFPTPFPATAMIAPAMPVANTAVPSKSGPDLSTPRAGKADTLEDAKKLMQEVLSNRKLHSIKDIEKTTTLYFMDTGGQPEFHEIMPIILNGPALHLIFFNLAFDLNEPIPIRFCHQDGTDSTITYMSSYTGKQMIFQLLSSLYYFSKSLSLDCEPAAVLIGTHLDQLKRQDEMKINDSLNRLLNNAEFHDHGFLTYSTKDMSTIFTPVNNYSGDEEEIHQLQAFLRQIIGDRFSPVELPSSWLFFHLLLRHRYENSPGVCKLTECRALARGCGLDEDDVPQVLRYIHQHLGTILFYEGVQGLNDLVICDPNVLFESIYHLVAVSFGGDKGYNAITAHIRKTGEIHSRILKRISTQSSNSLLKNEYIIELLMHFKILTELPSDDGIIYFMPCLLHPNNSLELSCKELQTLYPPPLLVRFKGNYIPMGVFSALVVKLLESSWELDRESRYRNHIVFNMDDDFSVEMIVHPAYLEFRIRNPNPTEDQEEIHQFCMKVCKTVVDTLISVLDLHAHTKKVKFQLGFYCLGSFQDDDQAHFCRLSHQRKINPKTFSSSDSPHCQDQCRLPPESTIWLEQWKNNKDAKDQGHACEVFSSVDSTSINAASTLTLKKIQNELNEMAAAKWYQLGVQLGILPATLSTIEHDYPHDAQRCMSEVIIRWLQNKPECSWEKLAEAVETMGGYAVLAEKLRQKMSRAAKSGSKED